MPRTAHTPATPAMKRSSFRFSVKAEDVAENGAFAGYGSVFNVVDSYGDIVLPGAFAESLAAHAADASMPACLWQHLPEEPIGVWLEMREDAHGLLCKGRLLPDVARGREALALMRAGALNGLSIGYEVRAEETGSPETVEEKYGAPPPAGTVRMLSAVDLWEVSLVTFPACHSARVETVKRTPTARERLVGGSTASPDLSALAAALAVRRRALRPFL